VLDELALYVETAHDLLDAPLGTALSPVSSCMAANTSSRLATAWWPFPSPPSGSARP